MSTTAIHYVQEHNVNRFVWGVDVTVCKKRYDQIVEHTSNIEYVTCKKCLSVIRSLPLVMVFEYTDGTHIAMPEIERMNASNPLLEMWDVDALKRLKIGETYVIYMGEYLIRIS